MSIKHVYGEYSDRIPEEVYEPHESIALDVHLGIAITMAFDKPPTDKEWDEAIYQNVLEAAVQGNQRIAREDIYEWSVLYVEGAPRRIRPWSGLRATYRHMAIQKRGECICELEDYKPSSRWALHAKLVDPEQLRRWCIAEGVDRVQSESSTPHKKGE